MLKQIFRKKDVINHEEQFIKWELEGRPVPPPHIVKQKALDEYRIKFNITTLVETGTYMGDMVESQKEKFSAVYSIELSKKLFSKAVKRFKSSPHIKLMQGDSGTVLNTLIPQLMQRALFWLDGHYSGGITAKGDKECPVINELRAILNSPLQHIILIDDARLFNGTNDYPTIEEIAAILNESGKMYSIESANDIIRLTPNL